MVLRGVNWFITPAFNGGSFRLAVDKQKAELSFIGKSTRTFYGRRLASEKLWAPLRQKAVLAKQSLVGGKGSQMLTISLAISCKKAATFFQSS